MPKSSAISGPFSARARPLWKRLTVRASAVGAFPLAPYPGHLEKLAGEARESSSGPGWMQRISSAMRRVLVSSPRCASSRGRLR